MKPACLLVFVLLIGNPVVSWGKELYLLSGCPYTYGNIEFPTTLHSIHEETKSLAAVRTVFPATVPVEFIHPYHDKRIVIVGQVSWLAKEKMEFAMVDMNNPTQEIPFSLTFDRKISSVLSFSFFDLPGQGLYQAVRLCPSHPADRKISKIWLLGIQLKSFEQKNLEDDVMKYIHLSGVPGTWISGAEWLGLRMKERQKLMELATLSRIEMDWNPPAQADFQVHDDIFMYVENDSLRMITNEKLLNLGSGDSMYVIYYVFNKKNQEWQRVRFPGGRTLIREFGPWLGGFVADDRREEESPGKEIRDQIMMRNQFPRPFRYRAEDARIYCPGILVLYNADTQQHYEIQTGQGDSEVLLVDDKTVYYRVNDEIHRAEIGTDRVTEGSLLAKEDHIVNIHWAFMGP